MKQGDKYMKLIMLVLALMVTSYVLYSLIHDPSSGVQTVQAALYSANEGISTQGVIVRSEALISTDFSLNVSVKAEGQRVAAGEEVAVSFMDQGAWSLYEEMEDMEDRLAQLQQALSYQTQLTDSAAVSKKLSEELAQYAALVAQGDLEAASERAQSVQALVLRQNVGEDAQGQLATQIQGLQREVQSLRDRSTSGFFSVTVTEPGYYSRVADGFESRLTPEFLKTAMASDLEVILNQGGNNIGDFTVGRLITSSSWYYWAAVDPQYLEGVETGDTLNLRLVTKEPLELTMEVWRLDRAQGLLILTADRYMSQISAYRYADADIVFASYSGLRVPKEAICYDKTSGNAGVYVLVNREAVWKPITLIYDVGDAYIAELDQSSTENLWPEDLILTQTAGLYDGKVVQ